MRKFAPRIHTLPEINTLESDVNEAVSFKALVAKADILTRESPPDEISAILEQAVTLDHLSKRRLMERIKQTSGMPIGEQKSALRENDDNDEPDHLELARGIIEHIGRENLLATVAHVWLWNECGVWQSLPPADCHRITPLPDRRVPAGISAKAQRPISVLPVR